MKLTLTDTAIEWFENEYPLAEGESIRFFGKTYGKTEVHDGFSVGIKMSDPNKHKLLGSFEENGRIYFASTDDEWFFNRYDFEVDFDIESETPIYHFTQKD